PLYLILTQFFFFFCNAPSTTEIYTLSLHDALPISGVGPQTNRVGPVRSEFKIEVLQKTHVGVAIHDPLISHIALGLGNLAVEGQDRKSTRLNSSHSQISYAVFCLKKKKRT